MKLATGPAYVLIWAYATGGSERLGWWAGFFSIAFLLISFVDLAKIIKADQKNGL